MRTGQRNQTTAKTYSREEHNMSTHEQLQSENKTLHTDLQALTATISAQGAELAEARELLKDALTTMEPDGIDTADVHHDITAYLGDKS